MRNSTRLCFLVVLAALLLPLTLSAQYLVSGPGDPDANGVYQKIGIHNGKPLYSNGEFFLFYKDCTVKWAIGLTFESHPYYSSNADGVVPANEGWHIGGKYSSEVHGTVMVARMNSMAFDKPAVVESRLNNGTFNDSIRMLLHTIEDPFTGENGDDFVADGKVTVSNLPEGLSISVLRKSDHMVVAYITGTATEHHVSGNVHNLTLEFGNSAFTDGLASDIAYSSNAALHVLFMEKYMVFDADLAPEVNGLYFLAGMFNNRPYYVNTDSTFDFKYKGCQWGAQWALTDEDGGCPYYSTSVNQETLPGDGWYDEGGGDGTSDTLVVVPVNGLHYSTLLLHEGSADNGSITDTLVITYMARENGNAFTGSNGNDFVAGGKAVVSNLPEGLTASLLRVNDTTLVLKLNGQAAVHDFDASVDNVALTFTGEAFSGGDASQVSNAGMSGIQIWFRLKMAVYGAHFIPEANGIYTSSGSYKGKPLFAKDDFLIAYRGCDAKWILKQEDPFGCPLYSTAVDGDLPAVDGWSDEGQGGLGNDSIYVVRFNTLIMKEKSFYESAADDGSIQKPILVYLLDPTGSNRFSGENLENLVTGGKVSFANVPEGLEAVAVKINDTTVVVGFGGNALHHEFADSVAGIEVTFNNTAFTSGNAAGVFNASFSDISLYFNNKYEVMGATYSPEVNGTYVSGGIFNNRSYFTRGEYVMGYRMCNAKSWMIIDGGDPNNLAGNYCPIYRNESDNKWPPVNNWDDPDMIVYPHHSLYAGNRVFNESTNNNTFDGRDTVVIAFFYPPSGSSFSGENGGDFVADGKVTITDLPDGLTASLVRTGDTTLAMTVKGHTLKGEDQTIILTFNDNAFTGTTAARVQYSRAMEIELDYRDEFLVASSGGDFASIGEALQSPRVSDGDILNLAGETFTENNLIINKSLTIRGQGPGKTIVQAAATPNTAIHYIFGINYNYPGNKYFAIDNLTLSHGDYNEGGAIYARFVDLYISNCEFVDNYAYYNGGAIYLYNGGLFCTNSTFAGNTTEYNTTNSAHGGGAIALRNYDYSGESLIGNCTFSDNVAPAYGGALSSYGHIEIRNSTFAGNSAKYGGGIYRYGRQLTVFNTIVADNTASTAGPDIYGSLNAYFSLIENTSGATINGSDNITGIGPMLWSLDDNGGPTRTCAIDILSPARDNGTNEVMPATDQRGVAVFNSIRDIGAYEYTELPYILVTESNLSLESPVGGVAETEYTVSAINLTGALKIEVDAGLGLSLTPGSPAGDPVLQIYPDAFGIVPSTGVYVISAPDAMGTIHDSIIHSSAGADSVLLAVTARANSRPAGDNVTITVNRNADITFSAADFAFTDPDGGHLAGIVVVSKETNGDLEHNEINVVEGEVYDGISGLHFRPYADAYGKPYAMFTYRLIDNAGLPSQEAYTMTINVNYVPEVQNPIPDGNATVGIAYSYVIPDNTFIDPDASVDPVYSATLADGSPLPTWLSLDGATGTFSGTPAQAGTLTIRVTATDEENAGGTDEFVITIGATGVDDHNSGKDITVFPNPADGLVTVTIPNAAGSMVMKVTSLAGTVVLIQELNAERNPVDLSELPAGVYLMHLSNDKQTAIRRIVVQ